MPKKVPIITKRPIHFHPSNPFLFSLLKKTLQIFKQYRLPLQTELQAPQTHQPHPKAKIRANRLHRLPRLSPIKRTKTI